MAGVSLIMLQCLRFHKQWRNRCWIWTEMPGSSVCLSVSALSEMNSICTFACVCTWTPWWARSVIRPSCCCRWTHCFPFVFVQVFGDYYHFRHHAVEKRALSGHRGMHIKLQKEPQVRLLSALTELIAALHVGNKRPKDRLDYTSRVCKSQEKKRMPASMTACQTVYSFKSAPVLPSVPLTPSKVPCSCKCANYTQPNSWDCLCLWVCFLSSLVKNVFPPQC